MSTTHALTPISGGFTDHLWAETKALRVAIDDLEFLHRLAVVRVRIPPLRERKEDLPLLVRATLDALGPRAVGFSLTPETLR